MKFVALISGGKDSIYNIQQCIAHGHELLALANLYHISEDQQGIESDSYMYQTVGTNVTLTMATALGKPIYRRRISGKALITTLQYTGQHTIANAADEVEDLDALIGSIKTIHPDLEGVSSGAIYSTYQKLRVENICSRYGLTSLAYLWQREQAQLLRQMIELPIQAIIIKVASFGLRPQHLGKQIKELEPYFKQLEKECGMNVCGEGGEYESLVLDCPLFTKRIEIQQASLIEVEKNELAPVAYLRIRKLALVDK